MAAGRGAQEGAGPAQEGAGELEGSGQSRQPRGPLRYSALLWIRAESVRGFQQKNDLSRPNPQHPGEQRGSVEGLNSERWNACDGESAAVRLRLQFKAETGQVSRRQWMLEENSAIRTLEKDGLCGLAEGTRQSKGWLAGCGQGWGERGQGGRRGTLCPGAPVPVTR